MHPSSRPFQDASVARTPSTSIGHSMNVSPMPPVDSASSPYQTPLASAALPGPPHSNLMDEISNQIKSSNSQTIVKFMRLLNLVLASLTITVGVLAWVCGQVDTFQKVIAGIYIIIAIWPLSMGNFWLTILDALLLFLNALFNFFVISKHPAFSAMPPVHDFNDRHHEFATTGYGPSGAHENV
uniref:Transmembrane protein n=1 Tax=Hyaloperonospora arabidopsidis (strain Emoy2) TaxID=559515 RepID=M4B5K3_HYAAE